MFFFSRSNPVGRATAPAAPAATPSAVGRALDAIPPLHPNVTLKRLPFFDKPSFSAVVKPTLLRGMDEYNFCIIAF